MHQVLFQVVRKEGRKEGRKGGREVDEYSVVRSLPLSSQVGEVRNLSKHMEYTPFVVMGNDKGQVSINRCV